jgi:hypothetical protein
MDLPSSLPPLPAHLSLDLIRTSEILTNGYHAAKNTLASARPHLQQNRYHQERILSELIPLLDALLESTSDAVTRSWCFSATITLVDLFKRLTECEALEKDRFTLLNVCIDSCDEY